MRNAHLAEWILSLFTTRERAAATVGDLTENASARGALWFWSGGFSNGLLAPLGPIFPADPRFPGWPFPASARSCSMCLFIYWHSPLPSSRR